MKKHTQPKIVHSCKKGNKATCFQKAWLNLDYAIQKQSLNKFLQELYAKA